MTNQEKIKSVQATIVNFYDEVTLIWGHFLLERNPATASELKEAAKAFLESPQLAAINAGLDAELQKHPGLIEHIASTIIEGLKISLSKCQDTIADGKFANLK
jgi:hypothetical protein